MSVVKWAKNQKLILEKRLVYLGIFVDRFIEVLESKQNKAQELDFTRQMQYPHWHTRVRYESDEKEYGGFRVLECSFFQILYAVHRNREEGIRLLQQIRTKRCNCKYFNYKSQWCVHFRGWQIVNYQKRLWNIKPFVGETWIVRGRDGCRSMLI